MSSQKGSQPLGSYCCLYMGFDARTPVPTTKGWLPAGMIEVGEEVFGQTGEPVKVTLVQKYTPRKCFKIWMKDGLTLVVDGQAGLPAYSYNEFTWLRQWKRVKHRISAVTPKGAESILRREAGRCRVPVCQPIRPKEVSLPIDPYVFGQWIIEPRERRRMSQTLLTRELVERYGIVPNRIPEEYLFASFEQRLALLRGILSNKPKCFNKKRTLFTVTIKDMILARQFQNLVESFGMRSSIVYNKHSYYFRVSFRSFLRLIEDQLPPNNPLDMEYRRVRRVEEAPVRECVFLKTEDPANAILVSEGFINLIP